MEAVPRLPMISFRLKVSTEKTSFGPQLKQYIAQFYGEDPESYNNEIHNLESLRGGAVRPTIDVEGIQLLKKYYCQLHFLKSRFPMEELQVAAVNFSWQDNYSTMACAIPDIRFELMSILYNIGALHSQLGAADQRVTPDGMKIACTHFQCAAWAFQVLRENYYQMVTYISAIEVVHFMELVCLAQAQECILEKSMMDNRKASIIAKVAVQVVDYYKKAQIMLQGGVDENNYSDYVQVGIFKEWVKYLNFKVAYHKSITLLYQGQQSEEQQKMGERVAFYQAAAEQLEVARKLSAGLEKKQDTTEALAFTSDFVEGKKKAAKNENDFIYHEEIPHKDTFPEVNGASLVKGIPFSVTDVEVSGPDLFARLIPMEAHEASSLYSERKAKLLRQYGELIENKDQKLAEFMSSLQIEFLNDMRQATGIPQEIVDRAAALSAKPNAIQDLISSMTKLSNSYHEVESLLNEIENLLKEEGQSEKEYQKSVGERPPSIIATDLSREGAKYREAHNKANEANQNLHRAMVAHVGNLKTLSQPLAQLQQTMPSVKLPDPNIDESSLKEVEMLLSKVDEMRTQRSILWAQLRDALHSDDITRVLVTKEANQTVEDIFTKELEKHQHLTNLIEQNTAAQENIIKAFIDAYARFSNTRRYLQGVVSKRQSMINSLVSSYDSYEDLLSKATKGIEFYTKLETNVTKLLQRIKSSCKVQQEEREQMLSKIAPPVKPESNLTESNTPKLKDYLDSMKKKTPSKTVPGQAYPGANFVGNISTANDAQVWPPGIRPTPLGSEINDVYDSGVRMPTNSYYTQDKNSQYSNMNEKFSPGQHIQSQQFGGSNQFVGGSYPSQPIPNLPAEASYQQYNAQAYGYYNAAQSVNTSVNKTDIPPQTGPTSTENRVLGQANRGNSYIPAVSNQLNPGSSSVATSGTAGFPQLNSGSLSVAASSTAGFTHLNSGSSNVPMSGTAGFSQLNPTGSSNVPMSGTAGFPQGSSNVPMSGTAGFPQLNPPSSSNVPMSGTAGFPQLNQGSSSPSTFNQMSSADANLTQSPYGQMAAMNASFAPQMNTPNANMGQPGETLYNQMNPQSYMSQYSSYIPTHYQQMNQPISDSPNLQYDPSASNSFYASGYATSQNFQSSGLATVQSNRYHTTEVTSQPDQTSGIYSATYGTAQTYPTNQVQLSYYGTDSQQAFVYPGNYPTSSAQNYNQAGQEVITSEYGPVSYNQSQYSEGYVGAGSLLAPNQFNPSYMYTQAGMNYSYNPNNTSSSNGGLTSPPCVQNTDNGKYPHISNPPVQSNINIAAPTTDAKKESSTIDLLSGLDFSISQVPLEPEQKKIEPVEKKEEALASKLQNISIGSLSPENASDKVEKVKSPQTSDYTVKVMPSKALDNETVKKTFLNEVDKYEKFVDVLSHKTLSGSTNLDLKWKEIQDTQDGDGLRKNISVARCYPMKNRFPDILPYDHSRIVLKSTVDDYINASYIKDISVYVPPVIITQTPLLSTVADFWTMILEQHVEFVLCVLGDNEIQGEIYWPQEKGKDIYVGNMVICLQNITVKTHWTERLISISIPDKKQFATIVHLQFTEWPENLLPASSVPFIGFVKEFINLHQQQKLLSNPIVVHCSSGIGRSGVACLLIFAILEATNSVTLPDLTSLANKITSFRKNILRDREHLKFAYVAFLAYMKQIVSDNANVSNSSEAIEGEKSKENSTENDPLSSLDPFWASRKQRK
ncbi:tyrosine-protein phosphatase non-receptor type 23 isoform X2 [Harmonia axyridis]|uniref:tyrosine-protein phosphatase non-receptor type 23 isoform X2 n=1 Tax=Harmonia axyridis TaxID=115357 RepID=UPI001E2752DE|nr:tyrosine-protein phosphatase non-receptor type 23 isoform X2 [Harmonia axyridis]